MKRVKDIFNATRYKKICLDCFKRKETFDDFFNLKDVSAVLLTEQPMLCDICSEWKPVIEDLAIPGVTDKTLFEHRPEDWIKIEPWAVTWENWEKAIKNE